MVSDHADAGARRNKRKQGRRVAGNKPTGLQGAKGIGDYSGFAIGQHIAVAFDFASGSYSGEAVIVGFSGGLKIEFPWNGAKKQIVISKIDVKETKPEQKTTPPRRTTNGE